MAKKSSKKQCKSGKCSLHSLSNRPEISQAALAAHRSLVREIDNIDRQISILTDTISGINAELPFMAQAVIDAIRTRMTLREMARRMGVSPTHLCQISNRKTPCSWPFYKRLVDLMILEFHTCSTHASTNASGK